MRHDRGSRPERWAKRIGLAAGLAVVASVVFSSQVPAGSGTLGADVFFTAAPTGELAVAQKGAFVTTVGLAPGDERSGALGLRNQTGRPLAVRLRALPDSRDLDHLLGVEIASGRTRIFRGRLGGLRAWTQPFRIDEASTRRLAFRVWLPDGVGGGWEGRIVSVPFQLRSTPLRDTR